MIDKVVELEAQVAEYKKHEGQINRLHWEKLSLENKLIRVDACNPFRWTDKTAAKREMQGVIEEFIKSYNYDIKLHGRAQGAKAFAGNIAGKLMDKYRDSGADKAPKKVVSSATKQNNYMQEQLPV